MRRRLGGLLLVLAAARCASSGPPAQEVPVISDPTGATASAENQRITTPGRLVAPPGAREMEIRVEKAGYETAIVILTPDSNDFRECFSRGVSSPSGPASGSMEGAGSAAILIGNRLLRIAADCSSGTDRLQPTLVFVRLVLLAEATPPP